MPQLNNEQRSAIIALLEDGRGVNYCARLYNVNRSVVSRLRQKYRRTGSYHRQPGSGRKRATSRREDRSIVRVTTREPARCARQIRNDVPLDRQVCDRTIRNRLHEANLKSCARARVPALNARHRQARLAYARTHVTWTDRQWQSVMFSDESRFCLFNSDRRIRVWRRRGQRYDRNCVQPVRAFNGGSVMVWGGISWNGRTDLVVLPPPGMTSVRYVREIVEPHVLPYKRRIGRNFVFMQDNARPHTAAPAMTFFRDNRINLLPHPAVSPDLNPIEHVWDIMGRRLRDLENPPANLQQLGLTLVRLWNEVPQEELQACINMRTRLQEVIRYRGGNTSY